MLISSFGDTVSDCEDRYDEIERRIRFPQKASLAEEKQSMEFINLMERYLVELEDRLMNFKDVEYKGFVKKESEIIELFYFKFQDFPLLSRMDAVADYFIDEVETLRDRDLADDEKDLIREKFMKLYVTGDLLCDLQSVPERKMDTKDFHVFLMRKES